MPTDKKGRKSLIFLYFLMALAINANSQEPPDDLNNYYRFPFSIGLEFQNYSPFAEYGSQFNIFEFSAHARYPLPFLPLLQPLAKIGIIRFDSQDPDEPLLWDNIHFFAGLGMGFSHRFAKNFELGGEVSLSLSQSYFENLLPEYGAVGQANLIAEGGFRIDLDPSYNFNISIHPALKYLVGLGQMDEFDGFIFSIGFGANYRFGNDPDSPMKEIRSIRFSQINLPPVFAAMQSYYVKNPAGTVTLTNVDKRSITDVNVSFFQNSFMDSPTQSALIPEIGAGESMTVDLLASFNREVFSTEGVTPLTGEVIVTYNTGGRSAEQRQSVSFDLYDKTSVTWDDDRKAAAFITPSDSALRNYASFIRQSCREETVEHFNENLQFAIQTYYSLTEIGLFYQIDPTRPFTEVQGNPMFVDSISLPRDTLKRITGDCDDLTVLYCSLLESVGIETGFITVPGHIYAVFNTGEPSANYRNIHPHRDMTINLDGELWLPVEITMIGSTGFREAWNKGAQQWKTVDPVDRGFHETRKSQDIYRPVGLRETDLGLQYGNSKNIAGSFSRDLSNLADNIITSYREEAERQDSKQSWNRLGIACAKFSYYREAVQAFNKVIEKGGNSLSAMVNLANVSFIREDYATARNQYLQVVEKLEIMGKSDSSLMLKALINISKTCSLLEDYDGAGRYLARAEQIDAETSANYTYLTQAADKGGTARASRQPDPSGGILFAEETEQ